MRLTNLYDQEYIKPRPQAGDIFELELDDNTVIETTIAGVDAEGNVAVYLDETAINMIGLRGMLAESYVAENDVAEGVLDTIKGMFSGTKKTKPGQLELYKAFDTFTIYYDREPQMFVVVGAGEYKDKFPAKGFDDSYNAEFYGEQMTDKKRDKKPIKVNTQLDLSEDAPALVRGAAGLATGLTAAAGTVPLMGLFGPILGMGIGAVGSYNAAKWGMEGADAIWDWAAKKLGGGHNEKDFAFAHIRAAAAGQDEFEYRNHTYPVTLKKNQIQPAIQAVKSVTETALNPQDPKADLKAKRKALQDIQMDPNTHKDPELRAEVIRRKAALDKEARAQGLAEGHADQQRKVFKKNGQPVGEVGIDPEASPGNGKWYMKCYAHDIDNSGYDSYEEAVAELKYCLKHGVAEAFIAPSLSAANSNAEFARQNKSFVPHGYKGRVDIPIKSMDEYTGIYRSLKQATKRTGEHVECGTGDGRTCKVYSKTLNSDDLKKFIKHHALRGLEEGSNDLRSAVLNLLHTIHQGASEGHDMIDYLADEFSDLYRQVIKSGDKKLIQAYRHMMDNGQEAEGAPDIMAQVADQSIKMLDSQAVAEAKYHGKEVTLGKPVRGGPKKFYVYVRDPSTKNIKKVNFGDPNMRIKKSSPKHRKSFRARHHCANPGPRTKARYWSCRKW